VKPDNRSGAAIATAVAALIIAVTAPGGAHAADARGKCFGANACKGQSACAAGKNACSGGNACKGQGFLELTKKQCDKIPGTRFEPEGKG
jgi:uncharacterized membrane protein